MKQSKLRNAFEEKEEDRNFGNGEFGMSMEHQSKDIFCSQNILANTFCETPRARIIIEI